MFAGLKATVAVLVAAGLVDNTATDVALAKAAGFLKEAVQEWLPTVPTDNNPAKSLALDIAGKSPVVYGGPLMSPAAYKWKTNFNENAKNVSWWNEVPELDHNELIGWSSHPPIQNYDAINIISSFEHPRVLKRFEVMEKVLSGKKPTAHAVEAQGSNELEHLLWTISFGDFVSIYLALLNNVNPAPVDLVEKFKTELNT